MKFLIIVTSFLIVNTLTYSLLGNASGTILVYKKCIRSAQQIATTQARITCLGFESRVFREDGSVKVASGLSRSRNAEKSALYSEPVEQFGHPRGRRCLWEKTPKTPVTKNSISVTIKIHPQDKLVFS
ncbi:uncharacterized protein LOC122571305 isoform X2 [Bombus pyrosoma]|uniref:uncharacterized protein LOC122571305 isoform X2 n=1 Tax=Bombus pyrosoma TaxID=396416 RepID=UPI001CB9D5AC|nr:uncharacterized protein LOC122571305 isoform X2 [Bombus pyrosoma]